jgi:hypothetical protein
MPDKHLDAELMRAGYLFHLGCLSGWRGLRHFSRFLHPVEMRPIQGF